MAYPRPNSLQGLDSRFVGNLRSLLVDATDQNEVQKTKSAWTPSGSALALSLWLQEGTGACISPALSLGRASPTSLGPTLLNIFSLFILGCPGSFCCVLAFSSCSELGCSLVVLQGPWLLLLRAQALGGAGLSSCSTWAQELWYTGLVALWHAESSWTRDQTRVPCIGRQILNHWTTRQVLGPTLDWGCVWVKWKVKHSWVLETAFAVKPSPKLDLSPGHSLSSHGLGHWDSDLESLLRV